MNNALEFTWDHFVHSPSRKDGISEHVERYLRQETCTFIDNFGKDSKLRGKTRLHACSLFHQFYLRSSLRDIPRWEVAVACMILSAKMNNTMYNSCKSVKTIIHDSHKYLCSQYKCIESSVSSEQNFFWMARIHLRERQIMERLHGELRAFIPATHFCLNVRDLHRIVIRRDGSQFGQKSKSISTIYQKCFNEMRSLFRSVISIFYPPNWLVAVSIFRAIGHLNLEANTNYPKFYLKSSWFNQYDVTQTLNINIIQYLCDEIDACDCRKDSVKDYTVKPGELYGLKDWAQKKRINLCRNRRFEVFPKEIQNDLRHCFRLKDYQCIDFRGDNCDDNDNNNDHVHDGDWILNDSLAVGSMDCGDREEGEIDSDFGGFEFDKSANSHLLFKFGDADALTNEYHAGHETYEFVVESDNKNKNNTNKKKSEETKHIDVSSDNYFQNWCTQRFVFNDDGSQCVTESPQIYYIDASQSNEANELILPSNPVRPSERSIHETFTDETGAVPTPQSEVQSTIDADDYSLKSDNSNAYYKRSYHNLQNSNLNDFYAQPPPHKKSKTS